MTALPEPERPAEAVADARAENASAGAFGASGTPGASMSDAALLERVRAGDKQAYGALWDRHHRAGLGAARAITTAFDADDLVSEAFVRVLKAIERGNGPTTAFRPYLVTTIRSVAARWGAQPAELTPEEFEVVDPDSSDEAFAERFDQSLTVRAFNTLPQRWQEVLWYTEAEQLPPREVAALVGIKPNAVSALAKRAREGLRHAWVQAHIETVPADSECRWAVDRLAASTRKSLPAREQERLDAHLDECDRCPLAAAEMTEASRRLGALILIGFLGAGAATAYGAFLKPAAATAATLGAGAGAGAGAAGAGSGAGKSGVVALLTKPGPARNVTIGMGAAVVAAAAAAVIAVAATGASAPPLPRALITSVAESSSVPQSSSTDAGSSASSASGASGGADASTSSPGAPAGTGSTGTAGAASAGAGAGVAATGASGAAGTSGAPATADPPAGSTPDPPPSSTPGSPSTPPSDPPSDPPPTLAPPTVSIDTGNGEYFPIVSGTGVPGATITVSDASGVSTSTTVTQSGSYAFASQFVWSGNSASDTLTVTQTSASGSSPPQSVPVSLSTPGATISVLFAAVVTGDSGATVQLIADEAPQPLITLTGGIGIGTVPAGSTSVLVRYSDGVSRFGPSVAATLNVL